ncbi:AfsA-related hotdog domain-containing protein [Sphaerisporangium aureirubrum]|uniref:AfsA-related hotdog domain-containing protein n=1 Tax=Sphaerisporangium aureirubrum TaxID=1544736 RepID=A0ABW1NK17_9ACTN
MSNSFLRAPAAAPASDWLSVVIPAAEPDGAVLRVDQDHPFFFDHPLDHVPGMLLVTGLLDLARAAAGARPGGHGVRLSLRFRRMCELDGPVTLRAEPVQDGRRDTFAVAAAQHGAPVCAGTIELIPADGDPPGAAGQGTSVPGGDVPVTPIAQELVHRSDVWNVVVGEPVVTRERYEAALVSPPAGHFLLRHGAERYAAEEIVEAGRQLVTAAMHGAHRRPRDTAMLWLSVSADLPAPAHRSVPLALRWEITPPRGGRAHFDLTLLAGGRPAGSLYYTTRCMSPVGYARFRANGGDA